MQNAPNSAVLETLQQPTPEVTLALLRLGQAARVSAHAPDFLLALLQGPGGGGEAWRAAVTASLKVLQLLVVPKLDFMPSPDLCAWDRLWLQFPGQ
jgi:hypothetical protein